MSDYISKFSFLFRPPDYTKGVFQTLGFKEFHEYLMLPEEQRNSADGKKLLEQSIENMKIGTRRYARRQNKMIRGRFLEHPTREVSSQKAFLFSFWQRIRLKVEGGT